MNSLALFIITIYQKIISPALRYTFGLKSMCRFSPSCSQYAKETIERFGVMKGGRLALRRLMQCQPFTK